MLTPAPAPWIVRGATFALWALAAGSAAYWGLKLSSAAPPVTAPVAAPRQVGPVDPLALARLLGSSPTAATAAAPTPVVALASRFQLIGVAAGAHSGGGAAVIAVDGKPARSYRVGSTIEEGLVLQSVHGRQAVIASREGQPLVTLEVPAQRLETSNRPAPMGVLPGVVPGVVPGAVPGAPPVAPNAPQPAGEGAQAPSEAPR
ncbi:type II secretion system protein N [Ramlibacter alkalitolerans]|uniref:General secretion pathway protein C n=1 Tax=Ramlibacter alkalitolerans TaxID=2039631 RepID=A0ABS1JU94_9BURK|nr:general secretion pathway protein C [Ramlibacter alkalitolerans]